MSLSRWRFSQWRNFACNLLRGNHNGASVVFRIFSYCTQTLMSATAPGDTLYKRLSPAGDPRVSIVPVLDQWAEEGRTVRPDELKTLIKLLRKYRRFAHALQLSEWMSNRRYTVQTAGDVAVRLDLISRVHGIEQAEKYFSDIRDELKTFKVYGALLSCYAHEKSLEKAEGIMQKMRNLGYMKTLSYNVMLSLYAKMGMHEKIDVIIQEMEEMGINCDKPTFHIRLNAYAAASDIEGMEKLLVKMETNPQITMDWHAYVIAANGYLKAGLLEKASDMLKKAEKLIRGKGSGFAYEILLSNYANVGNKYEVYRIWNLYKRKEKIYNSGYFYMISSLIKLNDVDGAEKILKEWESVNTSFDFRIPNLLINAFCRKGLLVNAEAIVSRAVDKRKEPPASTWDSLATGYCKSDQMEKAVDTMKKALSADRRNWILNRVTLRACMKYLKEKGEVESAEEFGKLLL